MESIEIHRHQTIGLVGIYPNHTFKIFWNVLFNVSKEMLAFVFCVEYIYLHCYIRISSYCQQKQMKAKNWFYLQKELVDGIRTDPPWAILKHQQCECNCNVRRNHTLS